MYARSVDSLPAEGKLVLGLLVQTEHSSALQKPFSSQEALLSMPNRPNDPGLQDGMLRLQDKLEKHSTDLATAEANIGIHADLLAKLERAIDELRNLVLQRTSASRTVTWKQLIGLSSVIVFVMAPLVSILVTAVYAWFLPQRIENVVVKSDRLNTHFAKLINTSLDERFRLNNDTLKKTIEENTNTIMTELKALRSVTGTTVTRKRVRQKFDHVLAAKKTSNENLEEIQQMLTAVEILKTPMERQDFQALSLRLYRQYEKEKSPERKSKLLATFIKAANAKSVAEPTLHHDVTAPLIERAKRQGNYFEGTVDLSSRTKWEGAVFQNCKIVISKPQVGVVLKNVRFLECNFDELTESPPIRDFLSTYLETTRSTVSFPGYKVQILRYKIGSVVDDSRKSNP